ncbi:MAG: dihydroorotase [Nitrospirae bacterium RBG_19FT_COMBO_42_15]|nr:MAG: dihydroorotase [Nitrospirae bacterium RBG_19FT_COMBO_42_15]
MRMLIKNGRVLDPANNIDDSLDIFIEGNIIKKVAKGIKAEASAKVIDAKGKIVAPGLIDIHTHLREPGFEYKETIRTGTMAAAAGGFTAICCMPNTNPINDNRAVTEFILSKSAKEGIVNVLPIGAITKGSQGKALAEISDMVNAGCVAISDDGKGVMDAEVMRRGLEYTKAFDIPVIAHCEDANLSSGGVMNEGFASTTLGLRGIPKAAEEVMVVRDIALAELTGARLHIAHVSSAGSVESIRTAKKRGVKVTCETCPHYFTLTEDAVIGYNTNAKVNPPLRTKEDVKAIKEGLKDGTIDIIASDHAPHAVHEKEIEFDYASFGMIGLETSLPLILNLVREGVLTLKDAIAKATINPARLLKLKKGTLSEGADADITIIDPESEWVVDVNNLKSKSKNTAFAGMKMKGRAVMTIVGGKIVYETGDIK